MKKVKTIIIMSILICCLLVGSIALCGCSSNIENKSINITATAELVAEKPVNDWTNCTIKVQNNIDKEEFNIPAQCQKIGYGYNVRVFDTDISSRTHYFVKLGYVFDKSKIENMTLDSTNKFFVAQCNDITKFAMVVNYSAQSCKVVFMDSLTNLLIAEKVCSFGGNVIAPVLSAEPLDYKFIGWDKPLENIQSNMTVYTKYTYARFVTFVINNDKNIQVKCAKGSTLQKVIEDGIPGFEGQYYSNIKILAGQSIDLKYVINDDITLQCDVTVKKPVAWNTIWWVLGGICGCIVLILIVTFSIKFTRRSK